MSITVNNNDNQIDHSGPREADNNKVQRRLLFVDDDPGILSGYKFIFENEGFLVELATDSVTAIELIMDKKFDMIILDYYLNGEKGFEVAKKILQIDPKIELIFISGESYAWEELKAKGIPVTGFFVKPLRSEALLDYVSEILFGIE